MTNKELKKILKKHEKWMNGEEGGERADFTNADLRKVNLRGANLTGARFLNANLSDACLCNAILVSTNFWGANLTNARLWGANLINAILTDTNFTNADLTNANLIDALLKEANFNSARLIGANLWCTLLTNANLVNANLYYANLSKASLEGADLSNAHLGYTNLMGACLIGANLTGVDFSCVVLLGATLKETSNSPYIPLACPDAGSFIGWKKARLMDVSRSCDDHCIVKLEICKDAKRSSATLNKCRASKVKVLGFETLDGKSLPDDTQVSAFYDPSFVYTVNTVIEIENFDEDRWNACAPGIHFFINRQDAVDYI